MILTLQPPQPQNVNVFVDEKFSNKNSLGENWLYQGFLIIPENQFNQVYSELCMARQNAGGYDREIHFVNLKNFSYASVHNQKTLVAKSWVQNFMEDNRKRYNFHLLGINLTNLNLQRFGPKRDQKRNIYRRFFRSSLDYALKSFFGNNVNVAGLYHDITELQNDRLFSWHPIKKLHQQNGSATFAEEHIKFVVSNHQLEADYPQQSQFIQLCDVLLGSFVQVIDDRNNKDGCNELADLVSPVVERVTDGKRRKNPNSQYHTYNRISASFFPSLRLSNDELNDPAERAKSKFYCDRKLLGRKNTDSSQLSLF